MMLDDIPAAGTVYIAILEDRHTDDTIIVCRSLSLADEIASRMMAGYSHRYNWYRDLATEGRGGWPRCWSAGDDGPKVRIEEHGVYG